MKNLLLFIYFALFPFSLAIGAVDDDPGRRGNQWQAPSFNGLQLAGQLNPGAEQYSQIGTSHQILKRGKFNPVLQVNTNRGTSTAAIDLPVPPNDVAAKNIVLSYNSENPSNEGLGVGWRWGLPLIEALEQKFFHFRYRISGSIGSGVLVETNESVHYLSEILNKLSTKFLGRPWEQEATYRQKLESNFALIVTDKKQAKVFFHPQGNIWVFNTEGRPMAQLNRRLKGILFSWRNDQLVEIVDSSGRWKMSFRYDQAKLASGNRARDLRSYPARLQELIYTAKNKKRKLLFGYDDVYLTKVFWKNGQIPIFWGSYDYLSSKKFNTSANLAWPPKELGDDQKEVHLKNYVFQLDEKTPILVEDTIPKENSLYYIDLNGDGRQERVTIHRKHIFEKVRAEFNALEFDVSGQTAYNCRATPTISLKELKRRINQLSARLEVEWAVVEDGKFTYRKDARLSITNFSDVRFDVYPEEISVSGCRSVLTYKIHTFQDRPLVSDFNGDGQTDLLICPDEIGVKKREKAIKSFSGLVKILEPSLVDDQRVKFEKLSSRTSKLYLLQRDRKKLDEAMRFGELNFDNTVMGVRNWEEVKGPSCHDRSFVFDWNGDGTPDIINGNSFTDFSGKELPLKIDEIKSRFKVSSGIDTDKPLFLQPTLRGDNFELINAVGVVSGSHGLETHIVRPQDSYKIRKAPHYQLLTAHIGHFGGRYQLDYDLADSGVVVRKMSKVSKDGTVESEKIYRYRGVKHDWLTGEFLGFGETEELNRTSNAEIPSRKIVRTFHRDASRKLLLFETRARLQGRPRRETLIGEDERPQKESIYAWDAKVLDNNRIFPFVLKYTVRRFHSDGENVYGVYEREEENRKWETHDGVMTFPLKTARKEWDYLDLINIFDNEPFRMSTISRRFVPSLYLLLDEVIEFGGRGQRPRVTQNSYNEFGEIIAQKKAQRERVFSRDDEGRLLGFRNERGASVEYRYNDNELSPEEMIKDDEKYLFGYTAIFKRPKLVQKMGGSRLEKAFFPEGHVKKIKKISDKEDEVTLLEVSPFEKDEDYLVTEMSVRQQDRMYRVHYDQFGEVTEMSQRYFDKDRVLYREKKVEGLVLEKWGPHFRSEASEVALEKNFYDRHLRPARKEIRGDFRQQWSYSYQGECEGRFFQGVLIKQRCQDHWGQLLKSVYLDETVKYSWSPWGELAGLNGNETSWEYDDYGDVISFSRNGAVGQSDAVEDFIKIMDEGKTIISSDRTKLLKDEYERVLQKRDVRSFEEKTTYDKGRKIAQKFFYRGNSFFTRNFSYNSDSLPVEVSTPYSSKKLFYDRYGRVVREANLIGNLEYEISSSYQDGEIASIAPIVETISYNAHGEPTIIRFMNGLTVRFLFSKARNLLKSVIYEKAGKILYALNLRRNKFDQVTLKNWFSPVLTQSDSQRFEYDDFLFVNHEKLESVNRNQQGEIEEVHKLRTRHLDDRLVTLGATEYFYDSKGTLMAGSRQNEDIDPNRPGAFVYLNSKELLSEGRYARLIELKGWPIAVYFDGKFYPAITGAQKELVGLLSERGNSILFLREFSPYGRKELIIESENKGEIKKMEQSIPWSYARLKEDPLDESETPRVYFSRSRAYSPSHGEWTSFDPKLKWSPVALTEKLGNWSPVRYASGDPINLIDPSGFSAVSPAGKAIDIYMQKPGGGKELYKAVEMTGRATLSLMIGVRASGPALPFVEKLTRVAGPALLTKIANHPEESISIMNAGIGFIEGIVGPGSIPGVPKGVNPVINEGVRLGARKIGTVIRENYVQR